MAHVSSGTGAGTQTPDGCSVNLYRLLPCMGELADIEPDLSRHSAALELGWGTGRLCGRMQELGLRATGVDESAEMLAHLPASVEGIKASIETPDQVWTQSFTTCTLEQNEIEDLLAGCGFQGFEWFGSEALWVAASPE